MRLPDLARSAFGALWRQKARTALTLSGVVVGTTALVVSLSLGLGLRELTQREFFQREEYWYVAVRPGHAPITDEDVPAELLKLPDGIRPERAKRLRDEAIAHYKQTRPSKTQIKLTPDRIDWIRRLPDVETVNTARVDQARVVMQGRQRTASVYAGRFSVLDIPPRLVAGRVPRENSANEAVVSERLLFEMGIKTDAEIEAALGQEFTVTFGGFGNAGQRLMQTLGGSDATVESAAAQTALDRIAADLPTMIQSMKLTDAERAALASLWQARKTPTNTTRARSTQTASVTVKVVGVVRAPNESELQKLRRLTQWWESPEVYITEPAGETVFPQFAWYQEEGHAAVVVKIRSGGDLEGFVDTIRATGLNENSAVEWLRHSRTEVTLISIGLNIFALVALMVAAIGITNTMVTGVIERTREIGILKAVGARDAQVLGVFLAEGAAVGVLGGVVGLLLARGISIPLNSLVLHLVEQQARSKLITTEVFLYPAWLVVGTLMLIVTVTVLAALYPAMRAARVRPVDAVRHE
jgi:putative ABC transport system permease protein